MIITEPIMVAFGLALWSMLFIAIGYTIATKESIHSVDEVQQWLKNTNSNEWVSAVMYEEMAEKYEDLLREYEQYKGCMNALKDSGIFLNEELKE